MSMTLHGEAQRPSGAQTQWLPSCIEPNSFSGTCDFQHRNFLGTLWSLGAGVGRPRDSRIQPPSAPPTARHSPLSPLSQRPLPGSKSRLTLCDPTLCHPGRFGKWAAALHTAGTPGKPGQKERAGPCLLPEPRAAAGAGPTLALLMVQCSALFSWS